MLTLLQRICMDCKKTYGFKLCRGSFKFMQTHGICSGCLKVRMSDLALRGDDPVYDDSVLEQMEASSVDHEEQILKSSRDQSTS